MRLRDYKIQDSIQVADIDDLSQFEDYTEKEMKLFVDWANYLRIKKSDIQHDDYGKDIERQYKKSDWGEMTMQEWAVKWVKEYNPSNKIPEDCIDYNKLAKWFEKNGYFELNGHVYEKLL